MRSFIEFNLRNHPLKAVTFRIWAEALAICTLFNILNRKNRFSHGDVWIEIIHETQTMCGFKQGIIHPPDQIGDKFRCILLTNGKAPFMRLIY